MASSVSVVTEENKLLSWHFILSYAC